LLLDRLLKEAVARGASDIHLSPFSPPIVRISTRLKNLNDTILEPGDTIAMAQKILGKERFAQVEEEGEVDTSYKMWETGNFRINIYRHQGLWAIACRVINTLIPSAEYLGLPPIVPSLARYSAGLILITGPTGSGKSTTMAALINEINQERACHIVTLEDPIEYIHSNNKSLITQREIGRDSRNFPNALRSALRQDPDVIMIGEMRDLETVSTAITAAETGHLVLATLHTITAPQTIERIIDIFPPYQQQQVRIQLANSLRAVICQRLLPRKGDERMVVACEIMICTTAIRNLIREGKIHQIHNAMHTGSKYGMLTMENALQQLIDQGLIESHFIREAK